jgi:hypothetical protein
MTSPRHALTTLAGIAIGLSVCLGGASSTTSAQVYCDPNYGATSGGCVPGDRDYDCWELHNMGIGDIPVIGSDWQRLDGYYNYYEGYWESYPDGLGCEWWGE